MTDEPTPLDPDQVACRKCHADPGEVCRRPNGDKSPTVHVVRRRDAAAGGVPAHPADSAQRPKLRDKPAGSSTFTSETASAAAKASAQERRRRAAEIAAAAEEKRAAAEAAALEEQAEALALDSVRHELDRRLVRAQALKATRLAAARLIEGLEGLQVVELDGDRRPVTRPIEYEDERTGKTKTREVPDVRGAYSAATLERLAKVYTTTLQALRLEEGKPTGIHENRDGGDSALDVLGETGFEELIAFARDNLPPGAAS